MPKAKGLTPEQKDHHSKDALCKRIRRTLRDAMDRTTIAELASDARVDAARLRRMFNGDTKWDVGVLARCCDVLGLPQTQRARLLTWRDEK